MAASVLREKTGSCAMFLSHPSRGGCRSRRDKEIDDFVSHCMD